MSTIIFPGHNYDLLPAGSTLGAFEKIALFVGQKNGGTATSGELVENIGINGEEDALFGADSLISSGIRAFRRENQITRVDAISLDDNGAGVAATGNVIFSGTATEAGTINVYVGSQRNNAYELTIDNSDTATAVGDALVAALTADSTALVSGVNTTGNVALTAVNAGTEGNEIGIFIEGEVAGITASITAMNSGSANPVLTGLFDPAGEQRYYSIVYPATFDLSVLSDFLEDRFPVVSGKILDGTGYIGKSDTVANLKTLVSTEIPHCLTLIGDEFIDVDDKKGPSILELDYVKASYFASLVHLRFTPGNNISRIISGSNAPSDQRGGSHTASIPYANTPFRYLPVQRRDEGFTDTERKELLSAGISVLGNNRARSGIIAADIATTRVTNEVGNPENTYKFLNIYHTATEQREIFVINLGVRFEQSRLTLGTQVPGHSMADELKIRAEVISIYSILADEGFVLLAAGEQALQEFKENLDVSINLETGTATINMEIVPVGQLREFDTTARISFSIDV